MELISRLKFLIEEEELWDDAVLLKRNDHLNVHGAVNTNLYFVERGSVKVFFEDNEDERILRLAYTGDILAALDSYITAQPSTLHIQAIKKTTLKKVSKLKLSEFLITHKEGMGLWIQLLELSLYQQIEREKDILTSSPVDRYKRVHSRSPRLFQEIPDKYIASYLRMSPETFSRIKSLDFNQDLRTTE